MDKDASTIEIAYFNRFHVPMARGLRVQLCKNVYDRALRNGLDYGRHFKDASALIKYLAEVVGPDDARDELREIGVWSGRPFTESDLASKHECYIRLALNAAHQIAIDEERGR